MKKLLIIISTIIVFSGIVTYCIVFHHATICSLFYKKHLDTKILEHSISLGREYYKNHQKNTGNFDYVYDFIDDKNAKGDSPVRQAGALWGLSLIHAYEPTAETRLMLQKGIDFFIEHTVDSSLGKAIIYPHGRRQKTGTQALYTLAMIEFIRVEDDSLSQYYSTLLGDYLSFLINLQSEPGGHFHSNYTNDGTRGYGKPSPYFDGEALLALCKAANYCGYDSLKPLLLKTAEKLYTDNVIAALDEDPDSDKTKGFYQWGSMSFYEIYSGGWGDHWAKRTIDMAYWMIDVHRTLFRTKNTAYAHEGMAVSWKMAQDIGDEKAMRKIGYVIDRGLAKLISWQIGSELENDYIKEVAEDSPLEIGGIMNSKKEKSLRIDVVQHQMHAEIMALEFIYKD